MGKPSEERKAEIVQTALDLAAESGVKKVTTQAIADRVGIAQPTIFRHFKSRDAIFSAAMDWVAENLFKVLQGIFLSSAPADQRLKNVIERQLGFISSHRGVPRVLFSDRLHLESPKLKAVVQTIMGRYTAQLTKLIEEGVADGVLRADLDPPATARLITAMIQGLVVRWSIFDFNFKLEDEAGPLWALLWPALRPCPREQGVQK